MKIIEFYNRQKHTFSFEFFPPKTDDGETKLVETITQLKKLKPSFCSITYGAMGTTRDNTLRIAEKIKKEIGLESAMHFTCVGHTREEIEQILGEMTQRNIENIVALRGDPPKGETEFKPVAGGFKYGSELVNLVADSTMPTGLSTFGFDDDGVRAQRWHIVKDGLFTGYQTNREFAHIIGEDRSKGANRADGWSSLPMIRITNLSLMPGDWRLEDLIADTKDGLFFCTNKSWSIDQLRYNFQFAAEIGWEIKNGKLGDMVKSCTYQGITPEFWSSCDAICNIDYWRPWGVVNCGKGQPGQVAEMSHGAAPARFRNVTVGVAK